MKILFEIVPIKESTGILSEMLSNNFAIPKGISKRLVKEEYAPYVKSLKKDLWVFFEAPYVDKVYRDSYYNYFSSKHNHNYKNCVRISFFKSKIQFDDFRDRNGIKDLEKKFWGFIVIRPTPPRIIGKSVISPNAFKESSFNCRLVDVNTTVNSVKMKVRGFPHASQDMETLTCAETVLWECFEYFGTEYPEYKTILPSQITNSLSKIAYERQLPSDGLNTNQISSVLKEFGFGSKIYAAHDNDGNYMQDFPLIFSTYIQSGIPLITFLQNPKNYAHTVLSIGHEPITPSHYARLKKHIKLQDNIIVYDTDYIRKKYVMIDDNYPPYQMAFFNKPCSYYKDRSFHNNKIEYFIVPLYSKIYLDAREAKDCVYDLISASSWKMPANSKLVMSFYLASTRSFKNWIALDSEIQEILREIILQITMPRFIWCAQLGTIDSFKRGKSTGIVLLDATSANKNDFKPLILAAYNNKLFYFNPDNKISISTKNITLKEFNIYQNLKN